MIWLSLAFNYAGLAAFAFSMQVHHARVFRRSPSARQIRGLRLTGGGLQALALAFAMLASGPSVGLVDWFVGWAGCGFALTLVLTLKPRWWPLPGLLALGAAALWPFLA